MNPDFENCLKKNKIRKFSPGKSLTGKEITTAESDIKEAKESLTREKYKWATIPGILFYVSFRKSTLIQQELQREKPLLFDYCFEGSLCRNW